MNTCKLTVLPDERWWGGVIQHSTLMPFDKDTEYSVDLAGVFTNNQINPFFISDRGRFIYSDSGFRISFCRSKISVEGNGDIVFGQEPDMRLAHRKAAEGHFSRSKEPPQELLFTRPQYNTWIKFMYDQNEDGILSYAESILDAGLPAGELILDCGWQEYYGLWDFHSGRFRDPKGMVDKLHGMGFKVVLWIVPFVSPDSAVFRDYRQRGLLIRRKDGAPYLAEWWDGYSAVLDFTNPDAVSEFRAITDGLAAKYGVDGFKQDGGDLYFYDKDALCYGSSLTEKQCEAYGAEAERFPLNELRSCFSLGGKSIVQRAADRHHSWDKEHGIKSLIPIATVQGLMGYPFSCPDMVGGGDYGNFLKREGNLNREIFIRYCQVAALMPMMQLSFDFWKTLDAEATEICRAYCCLRSGISDYILKLRDNAYMSFVPMVTTPEFFGYGDCGEDIFMLGEDVLVAPVTSPDTCERTVRIPNGKWLYYGIELDGGTYTVSAPIHVLPVFERAGSAVGVAELLRESLPDYKFNLAAEKICRT